MTEEVHGLFAVEGQLDILQHLAFVQLHVQNSLHAGLAAGIVPKGRIEVLLESDAIWNCLSCMACVERCPRGVAPAAVVEAVRDTVVRMQNGNGIRAEDIPPIVDELIPQQLLVSAYRKYNK